MFTQSLIREEYFNFVYDVFKPYCSAPPFPKQSFSKLVGAFNNLNFNTMTLPCFNFYQELFYKDGKKIVPINIIEFLTPISLSTWIMDDGTFTKRKQTLILCTDGFTELEIELLLTALRDKWELKCRKERAGKHYRIVIVKSSMDKVRTMVSKHFHSSMLYKIGL